MHCLLLALAWSFGIAPVPAVCHQPEQRWAAPLPLAGRQAPGARGDLSTAPGIKAEDRKKAGEGSGAAREEQPRAGRTRIPLKSIYASVRSLGLQHIGISAELRDLVNGKHKPKLFLVRARSIEAALEVTESGFGDVELDEPLTGGRRPSAKDQDWVVLYLGHAWISPTQWFIDSVKLEDERIRVHVSRTKKKSADFLQWPYFYWIPVKKLEPGTYVLEVYDEDRMRITMAQKVRIGQGDNGNVQRVRPGIAEIGTLLARAHAPQPVSLRLEALEDRTLLGGRSTGATGINALNLNLTGNNVRIGIVEHHRVPKRGIENGSDLHPDVNPEASFYQDKPGTASRSETGDHALWTAGVIASRAPNPRRAGIAPDARLFSSGFDRGAHGRGEKDALRSMLKIASLKVSAVNMGFGFDTDPRELDGGSQISLGLDYLAQKYDTLFVVAKGQRSKGKGFRGAAPQDSYNGLVVGGATKGDETRQTAWGQTDYTTGLQDRRLIHLIAPADKILVPMLNREDPYGELQGDSAGTSLSAAHATGAVALLQEDVGKQDWGRANTARARRHEVMKAILINSADKVAGALGMGRDVEDVDGRTWLRSDAADHPKNPGGREKPLDSQIGAGYLNVGRAVKQLEGGRAEPYGVNEKPDPDGKLPPPPDYPAKKGGYRNWDYGSIERAATDAMPVYNRYRLPELKKGDWIATTLVWDRIVDSRNDNRPVEAGFVRSARLSDLNLYLMKAGETDVTRNVWSSNSSPYNLEHIFYQLGEGGRYEIWVEQNSKAKADYALTWWATEPKPGPKGRESEGR